MSELMESGRNKTPKEIVTDVLLFLYIVNEVSKVGRVEGQKKLLKLIFFAEHSLLLNRMKGLNYKFYKYSFGPFSKEVYDDRDILVENDMLDDIGGFTVTERGEEILKLCQPVLKQNNEFIKYIDETVNKYAKVPSWEIEQLSKEIKIEGVRIRDLPEYTPILTKVPERQAKMVFDIAGSYIATLDVMLDIETFNSLMESIELAQSSTKLYSHEEVFQ